MGLGRPVRVGRMGEGVEQSARKMQSVVLRARIDLAVGRNITETQRKAGA